ncbi:MAG: DUF309 domain-containing protein [Chloroflexi bacterium]|nr:DUF309 domain-containing protein [Chloroflexota bacterium]MCI0580986.1 DUF309 domain-containing protein [Chloroflexota bacterium]MCI0646325.1 DUF309 domain-containing protein [Chloroflexota bacterium]MCI0726977.1 DUF309 domain-containing protein [Chloroflexota bacterium]
MSLPLIVAFVADLMVTTKIENVARQLGYRVTLVGGAADVAPANARTPEKQAAEPVFGQEAALVDKVTAWQPALLIFDLANEAIPWRRWIPLLKSSPATRRVPVLGYGPHVDTEMLQAARNLAADAVVARSRFMAALPELIQNHARVQNYAAVADACQGLLSAPALQGLEEFNRGEFFEAHEYLEEAWNEDNSAARDLYRAILQVAVAYLQIERGNYQGAIKMFLRVRQWLEPLPAVCRGVDVAQLRADAADAHQALLAVGPDQLHQFDRSLFRPVRYSR